MDKNRRRFPARIAALLIAICLLPALAGCAKKSEDSASVLLDGDPWSGGSLDPDSEDALRVYVTLDGEALIDLPFGEEHTVTVRQPGGKENTVSLTGDAVTMAHATCENQDCVQMGEVTRDNYELRALGGFIICLPQRVSVEVRGD